MDVEVLTDKYRHRKRKRLKWMLHKGRQVFRAVIALLPNSVWMIHRNRMDSGWCRRTKHSHLRKHPIPGTCMHSSQLQKLVSD